MPAYVRESSDLHRRMHGIAAKSLGTRESIPRYTVDQSDLEITATIPGSQSPVVHTINSIIPYEIGMEYRPDYDIMDSYIKCTLPLHKVATALRKEFGSKKALKLRKEHDLAREITGKENNLGIWGSLYHLAALLIPHHLEQGVLERVLYECVLERNNKDYYNKELKEQVELAKESENPYLARGLSIRKSLKPTYPLRELQKAVDETLNTNPNLLPGFDSEHFVEPTTIRPVDQVLAQHGLIVPPVRKPSDVDDPGVDESGVDEPGRRRWIDRIFGR